MANVRSVRRLALSLVVLVAATLAGANVLADATVTSSVFTCSSFTATGTTTAPYVTIYAYNYDTGLDYWTIVPVSGGAFAGTVTYPPASPGSVFNLEVWGTLAPYTDFDDPNYWDGGAFFDENRAGCTSTQIPALGPTGLALLAGLLGVAGAYALRRAAA